MPVNPTSPDVATLLTFAVAPGRLPEVLCEVDRHGTVELRLMVLANAYASTFTLSGPAEAVQATVAAVVEQLHRSLNGQGR
jgi:hypothetical protein